MPGPKRATNHRPNQIWHGSLTQMCVTKHQCAIHECYLIMINTDTHSVQKTSLIYMDMAICDKNGYPLTRLWIIHYIVLSNMHIYIMHMHASHNIIEYIRYMRLYTLYIYIYLMISHGGWFVTFTLTYWGCADLIIGNTGMHIIPCNKMENCNGDFRMDLVWTYLYHHQTYFPSVYISRFGHVASQPLLMLPFWIKYWNSFEDRALSDFI